MRKEEWEWNDATPADDHDHCNTSIYVKESSAYAYLTLKHFVTGDTNGGVTDATSPETTTIVIINVDTTGTVSISVTSSQDTNNA